VTGLGRRCALVIALAATAGCDAPVRDLQLVPALPAGCLGAAAINEVRVSALGDFPPTPSQAAAAGAGGAVSLSLPAATRVVEIDGLGPDGLAAFGRSAPLDLAAAAGRVAIAYGPPDALCPTGRLRYARAGHRATRLASGAVLLSGGVGIDGFAVTPLEVYLPSGDATAPPASFRLVDPDGTSQLDARAVLGHAVTRLADDTLLFTGGAPAAAGRAAGIAFEGTTHHRSDGLRAEPARLLGGGPRAFHSATRLTDGRVLVAGGCAELADGDCVAGRALAGALLYDPASGAWADAAPLARARWGHETLLLGDGSLLVAGGRGEGGAALPVERYRLDGSGGDAGDLDGRAALLPTGAVLLAGASAAALWLGDGESLPLLALPGPRAGQTVTALEDGAALVAGGGAALDAALVVYDGRGGRALGAGFARSDHTATLLDDGTVLFTGGRDAGGTAGTDAFIYLRSPLGPFVNLPTLTFDGGDDPVLPRRPDRAARDDGHLTLRAAAPADDGRPVEWALLAAMRAPGITLETLAGRVGDGAAALLFAWQSDASYAWVRLAPGQPVALFTVEPDAPGHTRVVPDPRCVGLPLDGAELPDGDFAPVTLRYQDGALEVYTTVRRLLGCQPSAALGRGGLGVGALHGAVRFDDLSPRR
jgi:hypothetical protein